MNYESTMLKAKMKKEIASMVRSGFYEREHLIQMFTEEMYAPGELDAGDVESAIDSQLAKYEKEKSSYPQTTDCDRLDVAFKGMNDRGVIAMQNAGYTQSDGFDDVGESYNAHPDKSSILGYCFYHGQDLERAISGDGLNFAFGPVNPADEQTVGIDVGKIVREELEKAGLSVDWDGTFETRLSVPKINWQKR